MKEEKKLISLKEASEMTGYSADYIGQLIRSGKIPGKQVYSNIAWMTTAEAVLEYKSGNHKQESGITKYLRNRSRMLGMELGILRLFFQSLPNIWPLAAILVIVFFIFNVFLIYGLGHNDNSNTQNKNTNSDQAMTF